MAQDPALARRAALWRAQNSAIRTAFDGEGARAFPISIVRHQNETFGRAARSGAAGAKPSGEQPPRPSLAPSPRPGDLQRRSWRATRFGRGLYGGWGSRFCPSALPSFGLRPRPSSPANDLGKPALRLSRPSPDRGWSRSNSRPATRAEAQAWLTTQLTRPVYLPATPSALKLVGARIAPYPAASAAFLVYRSQDRVFGLLVQSLDAPATTAPQLLAADGGAAAIWTWRGQGLALVGDLDGAALLKIAADFADLPAESAQPMPERGW